MYSLSRARCVPESQREAQHDFLAALTTSCPAAFHRLPIVNVSRGDHALRYRPWWGGHYETGLAADAVVHHRRGGKLITV